MRRNSVSALAIASLTMGILSLLICPLYRIHIACCTVGFLLGIGAILTGIAATSRIAFYPIRGKPLAYAGMITGFNGLFLVIISMLHRLM
jgi:hypothetical protein